jgi:hypothetical protein
MQLRFFRKQGRSVLRNGTVGWDKLAQSHQASFAVCGQRKGATVELPPRLLAVPTRNMGTRMRFFARDYLLLLIDEGVVVDLAGFSLSFSFSFAVRTALEAICIPA